MAVPECSKLMTSTNRVRSLAFSYVIRDILIKRSDKRKSLVKDSVPVAFSV